jgi:hypothetical protein
MIIILAGGIGRWAIGGHAWAEMQYLAGLQALGHDVYYLEECGEESWVYNWDTEATTTELGYPAAYVRDCLEPLGLKGRWIYRAGEESEGMGLGEFQDVCSEADLLIIRALPITCWRPEYDRPRRRIYIDADPGFTQVSLLNGDTELADTVERCERLFTFAQRIGAGDCIFPTGGRRWLKTLPPIALAHWPYAAGGPATHFTSVMNWRGFRDVVHEGVLYGQKDREFPKFLDVPRSTPQPFRLATTGDPPVNLAEHGWEVVPGWVPSRTPWSFRTFVQESRAEFGVAKHGYVRMRGGWFSDRSVCYLASGRPVVVQDTGLDDWLPTGEGVVTFRDPPEAVRAVEAINADYERHRRAARRLAERVFAAEQVLPPLLDAALE